MKFEDFSPIDDIGVAKATAHQNGKIGFSTGANKLLDFEKNRSFKVSKNADDPEDPNLYLVPTTEEDEKAFKVNKAGNYYYLRLKHILDKLDINYRENRVIFDIRAEKKDNVQYFKLMMRPIKKRKK